MALGVAIAVASVGGCGAFEDPAPLPERRAAASVAKPGCTMIHGTAFPAYGSEGVLDHGPVARERVAPDYPPRAREAGIDGTVLLLALVCEHGRVVELRVKRSIPILDAAAIAAVEQWTNDPAMREGRPAAAWTEAPIRFSLH